MGQNLPPMIPLRGDETPEERQEIYEHYRRQLESRMQANRRGLELGLLLVVGLAVFIALAIVFGIVRLHP